MRSALTWGNVAHQPGSSNSRLERDLLDRHLLARGLRQLCLLRQDLLSALCAFIAVEEFGQVLGLVGVDPDDDPGLTQGSLSD